MPRFKTGDRVQLVGDIARFYACIVGTVVKGATYPSSVLNQYTVRLADGTLATFFDFQLQTPPTSVALIIFDSTSPSKSRGTRGAAPGRHMRLLARDIDIHLRISGTTRKTVLGQVSTGGSALRNALVTLLVADQAMDTTSTDAAGEFILRDVQSGGVTIEILVPSRRIVAAVTL